MTGWTDGPNVAVCTECATPFAGMVCPNCRQRLEARDLPPYSSVTECLDGLRAEAGADIYDDVPWIAALGGTLVPHDTSTWGQLRDRRELPPDAGEVA